MGFNSAFKGLKKSPLQQVLDLLSIKCLHTNPKVRIVAMFVTVNLTNNIS